MFNRGGESAIYHKKILLIHIVDEQNHIVPILIPIPKGRSVAHASRRSRMETTVAIRRAQVAARPERRRLLVLADLGSVILVKLINARTSASASCIQNRPLRP